MSILFQDSAEKRAAPGKDAGNQVLFFSGFVGGLDSTGVIPFPIGYPNYIAPYQTPFDMVCFRAPVTFEITRFLASVKSLPMVSSVDIKLSVLLSSTIPTPEDILFETETVTTVDGEVVSFSPIIGNYTIEEDLYLAVCAFLDFGDDPKTTVVNAFAGMEIKI